MSDENAWRNCEKAINEMLRRDNRKSSKYKVVLATPDQEDDD